MATKDRKSDAPAPGVSSTRGPGSFRAQRIARNLATNPRDAEVNNSSDRNLHRRRQLDDGTIEELRPGSKAWVKVG